MLDLKVYAQKLRERAITDDDGIVKVSPELWDQIAGVIEWAADRWISVNDRLPEAEKEVLILCKASYGKGYRYQCIAFYEPKGMLREQSDYGWDYECCSEYSEEDDDYFVNEGWYERIHNWDEYSAVGIVDEVTHWMPLPDLPEERCNHEFVYDELRGRIVCKKCFHVLTAEEKRIALEYANGLRRAEESAADACPLTGCVNDLFDEDGDPV